MYRRNFLKAIFPGAALVSILPEKNILPKKNESVASINPEVLAEVKLNFGGPVGSGMGITENSSVKEALESVRSLSEATSIDPIKTVTDALPEVNLFT